MKLESGGKKITVLDGEPIFVIRAKDNKSHMALRRLQAIYGFDEDVVDMFSSWRRKNSAQCGEPD